MFTRPGKLLVFVRRGHPGTSRPFFFTIFDSQISGLINMLPESAAHAEKHVVRDPSDTSRTSRWSLAVHAWVRNVHGAKGNHGWHDFPVGNFISPTDFRIYFSERLKPPSRFYNARYIHMKLKGWTLIDNLVWWLFVSGQIQKLEPLSTSINQ